MPNYNINKPFEITDLPSPTTTSWAVPITACTNSPHLPQVLSTPHLIEAMQSTTLNILTANFKNAYCEVAVPGQVSMTHSAPVCAGVTLNLTTEFRGQEGNAVKFAVMAADDFGVVAQGMFSISVVCSVNLESSALLRQRPEGRAASLAGTVPNCPGGTGHDFTPRPRPAFALYSPPTASSPWGNISSNAGSASKGGPLPCQLCHPIRRTAWRGPKFKHTRVSRGFLHAVHHGPQQLVDAWVSSGMDLAPYLDSALYAAVIASRPKILDVLVEKAGADANAWRSDYLSVGSLLHLAVDTSSGAVAQMQLVQTLLRHGVDPNSYDNEYYWTPLHHAVRGSTIEIVRILLDSGADPNATEDEAWTSLHFAVQKGNVRILKLLVERGADIEVGNLNGDTPLMMAVRLGRREVARALLECGCNPDLGEGRGSVIHWLEGAEVKDLSGPVRCLRP
ncbi:ankyrin repeat-containing domain protein [Aspergillus keveii]|uniref:Ankyrin repeat-containing domain protein n=1 Tax=Aspergillus keveii TaxID=714993 RepID=A0ABR4FRG0_9EURO